MAKQAVIGIIGGSGFYKFLKGEEIKMTTPYGKPSENILLSEFQGKPVAFLPRHGKNHQYPPHKINYRANLFALKKLGVQQVLAPCAVGSLKPEIEPGSFVLADQFINQTRNRKDTFFSGPKHCPPECPSFNSVVHISTAQPYCPDLRLLIENACQKLGITCQGKGTVLVIEGPRFSTMAESKFYAQFADIINMTQYPEVVLARELEMCYANISLVTDYDTGLRRSDLCKADKGQTSAASAPVSAQEVVETFNQNNYKVKELILEVIANLPEKLNCHCAEALKEASL